MVLIDKFILHIWDRILIYCVLIFVTVDGIIFLMSLPAYLDAEQGMSHITKA